MRFIIRAQLGLVIVLFVWAIFFGPQALLSVLFGGLATIGTHALIAVWYFRISERAPANVIVKAAYTAELFKLLAIVFLLVLALTLLKNLEYLWVFGSMMGVQITSWLAPGIISQRRR